MACYSPTVLLASFSARVRGVKFFGLRGGDGWFWERAEVERDPGNSYDANCVEVLVRGRRLGHLAKEAAEFVSPLLAAGFVIKARITSCPYVEERVGYPMGINNWRYRVMDVLVGIQGERQQRDKLIDAIEGFACVVHDMRFWPSEDKLAGIPPVASMTKTKTVTETKENNYDSDETCLLSDIEQARNYDSDETCLLSDVERARNYDSDETCLLSDIEQVRNYDSDETCLLSDVKRARNYDSDETCSLGDSKRAHDYDSDETCLPDDPTSISDTDISCTDFDMTHVSETDLDVTIDLPETVN